MFAPAAFLCLCQRVCTRGHLKIKNKMKNQKMKDAEFKILLFRHTCHNMFSLMDADRRQDRCKGDGALSRACGTQKLPEDIAIKIIHSINGGFDGCTEIEEDKFVASMVSGELLWITEKFVEQAGLG